MKNDERDVQGKSTRTGHATAPIGQPKEMPLRGTSRTPPALGTMRLFFAVKIPQETKQEIHDTYLKLIPRASFKAVEKDNLHITMLFIGQTSAGHAAQIKDDMKKVESGQFNATITGTGSFSQRVIWLGITEGSKELCTLAEKISEATGIEQEMFHAHITLARNKSAGQKEFSETMQKLAEQNFVSRLSVKSFSLMQSRPGPKGPVYEELSERTFARTASGL